MIRRTFIVRRASFYLHMYRTIVLPKLLYCCTVWSPYLQRDIKLLEACQKRFLSRVRDSCGPTDEIDHFPTVMELHAKADLRAFSKIVTSDIREVFFKISERDRRPTTSAYAPLAVAKSDAILNSFSFRVTRSHCISVVPKIST